MIPGLTKPTKAPFAPVEDTALRCPACPVESEGYSSGVVPRERTGTGRQIYPPLEDGTGDLSARPVAPEDSTGGLESRGTENSHLWMGTITNQHL